MLPDENASYGQQSYWDGRYLTEEAYDWFPSVYQETVNQIFAEIESVYLTKSANGSKPTSLRLLHLGTGNSSLVMDLHLLHAAKYADSSFTMLQVAMDYSTVVIDRMKQKYGELDSVEWRVADVRDLSEVRAEWPSGFDVVIDKGTMDALQADKENDSMEEDIHRMLQEVSASLSVGPGECSCFLQVTWEVPLYRLFYTLGKEEGYPYVWKDREAHRFIADSDMYRIFVYKVSSGASAS